MSGRSRYLIRPQGTQTGNKGLRLGGAAQNLISRSVSWVKRDAVLFLLWPNGHLQSEELFFIAWLSALLLSLGLKAGCENTQVVYSLSTLLWGSLGGKREREMVTVPLKMLNFMALKSFNVAAVTSDYWYTHGFAFILLLLRSLRHTMSIYLCGAIYYFYSSSVCISAAKREKIARHTLVSSLINLKRNLFEDKPENRSHTKVMNLHVASWGIHPILYFLRTPISLPHLY